tara:strand:- start:802 stop:1758 length:957 start_codon:yes stop_codon:yes gene_type:complete
MIGCNYWALPNMGKMHLMKLCDINNKSYTKTAGRYYFYKRNKKVQETFFVRKGESKVETRVKTKTEVLETHRYLQDAHNSSFEERENLITEYFGNLDERHPPDILMKDKDPVDVFFTNKWFAELQKHFPVTPSGNYLETFLEPYILSNTRCIRPIVDELCDVDIVFNPLTIMGKGVFDAPDISEVDELERYVLSIYKSRKNILPYKENLIDCFASKLKRAKIIKEDKNVIWRHLDGFVRNFRKLEKYLQHKGIEITYFNMDTDDYKEIFGFDYDIPRDTTHPGNYPERDEYEKVAKEYVIIRDMKDMRRRNRLRDRIQ